MKDNTLGQIAYSPDYEGKQEDGCKPASWQTEVAQLRSRVAELEKQVERIIRNNQVRDWKG